TRQQGQVPVHRGQPDPPPPAPELGVDVLGGAELGDLVQDLVDGLALPGGVAASLLERAHRGPASESPPPAMGATRASPRPIRAVAARPTGEPRAAPRAGPTIRAATYTAKLIALMKKLVGQDFTSESRMPPSVAANAMATLRARASMGRAVSRVAAAAGVITRVRTSSTPTTWMASAVVSASSSNRRTEMRRRDTPRASAPS